MKRFKKWLDYVEHNMPRIGYSVSAIYQRDREGARKLYRHWIKVSDRVIDAIMTVEAGKHYPRWKQSILKYGFNDFLDALKAYEKGESYISVYDRTMWG